MIAKIEGSSAIIPTRASPAVLAALPQVEGRRSWLKGGGLKIEDTPHNRAIFERIMPSIAWENLDASNFAFDAPDPQPSFSFKRKPDPHQEEALKRMHGKNVFGLFLEQGTGKTKVAIDRANQLFAAGQISGVLVVTKKGVHRQWIDSELPKDHSAPYEGGWWEGRALPDCLKVQGGPLKWWSVNYDALRSTKAFKICEAFCRAHNGRLLIIADESQCIKNHSSARHKAMTDLKGFSSHRLLLTGTPIAKDLTDEWAQLKWLDQRIIGVKYITTFRVQYCIMGGYEGRAVVGHKNLEEFKTKVAPWTHRVTKQQIGYIPKRYKDWVFDLTKDQKALIRQVKQELIAEVSEQQTLSINSATAAFTKVQQIANGFLIDEHGKVIRLMPTEKNPRAIALLEWLEANEGKAVIWTRFIADREIVAEALRGSGIGYAEYSGSDAGRHSAKTSFIEDGFVRGFLANPQSAGAGLDGLQTVCSQALYYSNSFNSIDRWQSEDRIDRRGMIGGSVYTDLIAKGSTDRHILRNLGSKKGISSMTLGDIECAFNE